MNYADASLYGRRTYLLEAPVIKVEGKSTPSGDFQASIDLASLNPNYERLWLRRPFLKIGIWIGSVGCFSTILFGEVQPFSQYPYLTWFAVGAVLIGFGMVLFSLGKLPAVQFRNDAGVEALTIFEAGPRKAEFAVFVSAVQACVIEAKKTKANHSPEPAPGAVH